MNKTINRISLILIVIILLPAIVLTSYQFFSINKDEKIIEEIYGNQLNTILFSVNQYSEDIVSDWANQVDDLIKESGGNQSDLRKAITEFLQNHNSINLVFLADSINSENIVYPSPFIKYTEQKNSDLVYKFLDNSKSIINRLRGYKKANYRKLEPLENDITQNDVIIIFLPDYSIDNKSICGFILNPKIFSEQVMSPKIQSIARNDFVISIYNERKGEVLYQNANFPNEQIQHKRPLWLIPEGTIGIYLKDSSIEDLVSQKKNSFIIIISLLTVTLVAGVWFVYTNVKKEIKLAQIKSDFVSNVSHELRTPLALISMFAETLEMDRVNTEEKKKEYYKIISQETNRLGRIVNTILNFSKMEAGQRKFNFIETDLNSILDKILNTYKFHLQNKGFNLIYKKSENIEPIYADEEALSEALINLIDNAMKYSKETKEISITTGNEKDNSYVEIRDKGIGIKEEEQKKVFEKFYRVSTGLIHTVKGTGLGLTLVKQIIDMHHGTIDLKSKYGKGSTFKLSFPVFINGKSEQA